jgi:Helix-turn-helix.
MKKDGISSGSYSQWNTGMHSPSLKKLQKAALVLGVPVEYLLYGDAPAASEGAKKAPDPEIEGGMKDEDLKEAVELLKKMDKETLRIFIKAARGALED